MATMQQIQVGFTKWLDVELVPSLTGWQKLAAGAGGALVASGLPNVIKQLSENKMLSALDIIREDGVDVDKLYQAVQPRITEKLPVDIPVIGRVWIGREDVDKLYKYIKEA